jgi:hypothetical protein
MKFLIIMHTGRAGPFVMMDVADALQELGHEILILQTHEFLRVRDRMPRMEALKEIGRNLLSLNADAVIGYGATPIVYFPLDDGTIVNLFESLELPYVCVFYDNPTSEDCFPIVTPAVKSDLCQMFVWDRYYTEELKKLGFRHVYYMPIATNTKRYRKLPEEGRESNKFKCDVSFVGTWSPKRELTIARLLDFDLIIHGYDWQDANPPELRERFRDVADNIEDLPYIYNYSKVNVNVTMEQGISSLNMRVFDVMACEGFLISDYKPDFEELFDIDKEIVCYRNVEELPELTKYYLGHDKERREKARLARRRVLHEHNYKCRAKFIVDTLMQQGIGKKI